MTIKTKLAFFEGKEIRRIWDEVTEKWFFSVVDVVSVLSWSDGKDIWAYWRKLKQRLKVEWSEVVTKCHGLKLLALDGKYRITDVADTEVMFRIIQSIPSPNAEPFKLWFARIWYERIEETDDPELWINRALQNYLNKWYSEDWVNQRLKTIEVRKTLTDEWKKWWILHPDYAILTDEITSAWAWMRTREYKDYKWLKKENLRDNMNNLELILNMLAEATTTEINKKENPKWLEENKKIARTWWEIAGNTRKDIEKQLWESVISNKNHLHVTDKKWESRKQELGKRKWEGGRRKEELGNK